MVELIYTAITIGSSYKFFSIIFDTFGFSLIFIRKAKKYGDNNFTVGIHLCDIPARPTNTNAKTKTMKDYFETNEQTDFDKLLDFNQHTKVFYNIQKKDKGSHIDALGYHENKLGEVKTYGIELKHRFVPVDRYNTMFIEDYKMASMLLDYVTFGIEPLYVNFMNDGYVVIFNLRMLKHYPKVRIANINSKGKEMTQLQERRYLLDMNDAVIYKNYQLIKGMNDKWKTIQ